MCSSDLTFFDLAEGAEERVQEDTQQIARSADTMVGLLDGVLELSRIGRVVDPPEEVPLDALVREVLATLANRISAANVQVEVFPSLPTLWADRKRMSEVVQNLIDNAIKYMGEQPEPRIEIGARQDGDETTCYVRDNGTGIEPRYHEKVFGLFDQLDPKIEGSGIGLTLTQRIVEAHGGRIWCESDGEGRGATFFFTIPPKQEEPADLG